MNTATLGILVGGLVPMLGFTFCALFAKKSAIAGVTLSSYLIAISAAIFLLGVALHFLKPQFLLESPESSTAGLAWAFGVGLAWAVAAAALSFALDSYGVPISKLASLHNCGALLVVLFAFLFLGEASEVMIGRLVAGSVLIVIGATLVVNS